MIHKNVLHLVLENKSARNPGVPCTCPFALFCVLCHAWHATRRCSAKLYFRTTFKWCSDRVAGYGLLASGPFVSLKKQRGSSSGTSWACSVSQPTTCCWRRDTVACTAFLPLVDPARRNWIPLWYWIQGRLPEFQVCIRVPCPPVKFRVAFQIGHAWIYTAAPHLRRVRFFLLFTPTIAEGKKEKLFLDGKRKKLKRLEV